MTVDSSVFYGILKKRIKFESISECFFLFVCIIDKVQKQHANENENFELYAL